MAEVFSGKLMELEEDKYTERREKVYTFLKIPREFEKVMVYFICSLILKLVTTYRFNVLHLLQMTALRFKKVLSAHSHAG